MKKTNYKETKHFLRGILILALFTFTLIAAIKFDLSLKWPAVITSLIIIGLVGYNSAK